LLCDHLTLKFLCVVFHIFPDSVEVSFHNYTFIVFSVHSSQLIEV